MNGLAGLGTLTPENLMQRASITIGDREVGYVLLNLSNLSNKTLSFDTLIEKIDAIASLGKQRNTGEKQQGNTFERGRGEPIT
jgi:hypothetical protein